MNTKSSRAAASGARADLAGQGASLQPPPEFNEKSAADTMDQVELVIGANWYPDDVKHLKVLHMRIANKMAKRQIDIIIGQIEAQVNRISAIKAEQASYARIRIYARQFFGLFDQGENDLQVFNQKNTDLVSTTDYLYYEDTDPVRAAEATSLRDKTAVGIIRIMQVHWTSLVMTVSSGWRRPWGTLTQTLGLCGHR